MPPLITPARPLVGRSAELAALRRRVIDVPTASVTLLGGDAGVGKTRLLAELVAEAERAGAVVLVGHCLELGDSNTPYLPVSELLGRGVRDDPRVEDVLSRHLELGPLLPSALRDTADTDAATDPLDLFDAVHAALEDLAASGPVLVVVEDAHWADRSTRELLTFLLGRGFRGPVALVVSYRADDLHRRHPLRPRLAEWSRLPTVERMVLAPMPDADVALLVRVIEPEVTDEEAAGIVARSGGNPFFAEELVAARGCGLPDDLADLLLVRVDALPEDTRRVLRAASVEGRVVDHDLLAEVVDLPRADLEQALRAAVDLHLVEVTGSGAYAFRHALLAEAILDDLLPGERVDLHRRYAEALRDRRGPRASAALAYHARQAGDIALAAQASFRAGKDAMAVGGPADAARHFEDVLVLLAENPALVGDLDADVVEVSLKAGAALLASGDPHRALELFRAQYAGHTGDLQERARLVAAISDAQLYIDQAEPDLALVDEAIGWLDRTDPNKTMAALWANKARMLITVDRFDEATIAATEALGIARDLELADLEADVLMTMARLDDFRGDSEGSLAALRGLIERTAAAGDVQGELRARHQLARVSARADDFSGAVDILADAVSRAAALGVPSDPFAIEARALGAHYAVIVGRWEVADVLLDTERLGFPALAESSLDATRITLAALRGDADAALAMLPDLRSAWPHDMFTTVHSTAAAIDAYAARGDLEGALAVHDEAVTLIGQVWALPVFDARARLSALVLAALADAVVGGADPGPFLDRVARLTDVVATVAARREGQGVEMRAWLRRAEAEAARFAWAGR
ncbi:ATP-binding protein, partial [Nostocoides japonicum]|uniref:ATP-binding protein n=1 Tax=Nostocoides japonicum TaxID=99481 RepID=UPI00065BA1A5